MIARSVIPEDLAVSEFSDPGLEDPSDELPQDSMFEAALVESFRAAVAATWPFRHFLLRSLMSSETAHRLSRLSLAPLHVNGSSGRRELHNAQRHYFDAGTVAAHPICALVARSFQSGVVVRTIEQTTGASVADCRLRIEYALDTDGFWLEPHTDLGVKAFTLLMPLPDEGTPQDDLGTDLYCDRNTWAARTPFAHGSALAFVPSDTTWHGFERRPILGVRRSLIVNFVTPAWRATEQLVFPNLMATRKGGPVEG